MTGISRTIEFQELKFLLVFKVVEFSTLLMSNHAQTVQDLDIIVQSAKTK